MDSYSPITPLWDLSQASNFSQLPDDDFLALLQKQFPSGNNGFDANFNNGINPQSISRYPLPSLTPPSEDSSPSPPSMNDSNKSSPPDDRDDNDAALKRKASDEDLEEGPSQKNQHTLGNKKGATSTGRRKSSGAGGPDDNRLLKRKEQNRAAQRAFRERKEKHVRDLEEKVAALEAKNEAAASENENLRDLLTRLQSENVQLKESTFTFAVPKSAGNADKGPVRAQINATSPFNSAALGSPSSIASSPSSSTSIPTNPLDWSSLTTFDPAVLALLDDTPQQTATDGAMQLDFGFGQNLGLSSNAPYTTIASNPMFMSFASAFDHPAPENDSNAFTFDMNSLTSWSTPTPSSSQDSGTLDDLFGGGYMSQGPVDFSALLLGTSPSSSTSPPSSVSPIVHHISPNPSELNGRSPASSSSGSSPSSHGSDPSLFNTPRASSSSESEMDNGDDCPKTKADFAKRITEEGASPFAPTNKPVPAVRKNVDAVHGSVVMCQGSNFPQTEQSDKNVEVLTAWRTITSNPRFKDVDINELCTEFTNKARCDGTKVVLEPQGVSHILESMTKK